MGDVTKIKIFVSAYACEPNLGSEIGVGWHWVVEMSKYFELWVLTRRSNQNSINEWLSKHAEANNLHFVYWDLPKWARFWKRGMRGVRLYYNIWQICTNTIVKRMMIDNNIKVFHHLTYGNAIWRVSNYGRKQFFIWGPIGVGTMLPRDFTKHYRLLSRCKESMQRLSSNTLKLNLGFISRCKDADLILCKTDESILRIPNEYRDKCVQFTDVAVELKEISSLPNTQSENVVSYLAAGTLVGWRNFDVLLLAFAKALQSNNTLRLTIVGGGDDYEKLTSMVKTLHLEPFVRFTGQLCMEEYYKEVSKCDVVINPCLREGAVTVSFDSMSFSKPLICFDTGGYTHYFDDSYAYIIKGVKKRVEAVNRLCEGILFLSNKHIITEYGKKANAVGKQCDWSHKGLQIAELFRSKIY